MKKLLSVFLAFCMLLCAAAGITEDSASAASGPVIEKRTFPFHLWTNGTEPVIDAFPLYFVDGVDDLPYVNISDLLDLINLPEEGDDSEGPEMVAEINQKEETVTVHTEGNDSVLWFNFAEHWAAYSNFETFAKSGSDAMLDVLPFSGFNPDTGLPELFQRVPGSAQQREGNPLSINLKNYDIPMIHQGDLYLLPMHTAFDLMVGIPSGGIVVCFNGEGIFAGNTGAFNRESDFGKLYYSVQVPERSAQLALYGVNELCMELDHFYGLKEAHGISSFYDLVAYSGLAEGLLDPAAVEADNALARMLNYSLDDGHSGYKYNSWMTGLNPEVNPENVGNGFSGSIAEYAEDKMTIARLRNENSTEPYSEVGNTAYIYLEGFQMEADPGVYYDETSELDRENDTAALVIYAHRQIMRENSPIENVVVDLSNNGGGTVDAAIFLLSWFLGEAPFSSVSPVTGAQRTALYRADINLDREFDAKDTLEGKNLYCLISPVSFSCGNYVPSVFKSSSKVTLLGDTTGGGSCVVLGMSTAWGTLFQVSGPIRISFLKNGSYYDADRGVDPDVFLSKTETFCDREKLTEIIRSLP